VTKMAARLLTDLFGGGLTRQCECSVNLLNSSYYRSRYTAYTNFKQRLRPNVAKRAFPSLAKLVLVK
jgi:hypothetical protein